MRGLAATSAAALLTLASASWATDAYEPDDTPESASALELGLANAQRHDFHVVGDVDWFSFPGVVGFPYQVFTFDLAPGNETVLQLFDVDGETCLEDGRLVGQPYSVIDLDFLGPPFDSGTGIYPARVVHRDCLASNDPCETELLADCAHPVGEQATYSVAARVAVLLPSFLAGRVRDAATGALLSGVTIRYTDEVGTRETTSSGGAYGVSVEDGPVTIVASKSGYATRQESFQCPAFDCPHDIVLQPGTAPVCGGVAGDGGADPWPLLLVLAALARRRRR